jgi:hypothetical protein
MLTELPGSLTLAEGLRNWRRRGVCLLNNTLAFALQLRKITGKLRLIIVLDTNIYIDKTVF